MTEIVQSIALWTAVTFAAICSVIQFFAWNREEGA